MLLAKQTLLLFPFLLVCSCAGPPRNLSDNAADAGPISAALTYFRNEDEASSRHATGSKVMLVNRRSDTHDDFVSRKNLTFYLERSDQPSRLVPEDARLDMERRTRMGGKVPASPLPALVRVLNLDSLLGFGPEEIYVRYPDTLSCVRLFPPGSTWDAKHALVAFTYSPSCNALYLSELRGGVWRVVRHHIVCFPT